MAQTETLLQLTSGASDKLFSPFASDDVVVVERYDCADGTTTEMGVHKQRTPEIHEHDEATPFVYEEDILIGLVRRYAA